MIAAADGFRIVFPEWYDERGEWEAKEKGWLQGVKVIFANGDVQELFFYDPIRLAQDMDHETSEGRPFIANPGLVIVPNVTRDAIVNAVASLSKDGYFPIPKSSSGSIHEVIHYSQMDVRSA